jgi:hypothetical protein
VDNDWERTASSPGGIDQAWDRVNGGQISIATLPTKRFWSDFHEIKQLRLVQLRWQGSYVGQADAQLLDDRLPGIHPANGVITGFHSVFSQTFCRDRNGACFSHFRGRVAEQVHSQYGD